MYKNQPLVMLPTNKAEGALIINGKMQNYRADYLYTQEYLKSCNAKSYHLYILSDDEIKEDDWYHYNGQIIQANGLIGFHKSIATLCKKIIATTNTSIKVKSGKNLLKEYITIDENLNGVSLPKISTSFIQYFIEHYNKGNIITKVNVEYVIWTQDIKTNKFSLFINPFNCINIKTIKDSYSRDEVIRILNKFGSKVYGDYTRNETMEDFTYKWIEQNL